MLKSTSNFKSATKNTKFYIKISILNEIMDETNDDKVLDVDSVGALLGELICV